MRAILEARVARERRRRRLHIHRCWRDLGAATRVVLDASLDRCPEYLGGAEAGVNGASYGRVEASVLSSYLSLPAIRRRGDHHILHPGLCRCLEYPGEAVGEERRRRR